MMKIPPSNAQLIVNVMQKGTKFLYSYMDGESRRLYSEIVFAGTPSSGVIPQVADALRCATLRNRFIPEQVALPPLRVDMVTESDAVWHTLEGEVLQETIGHPPGAMHIDSFINMFINADWNEEESPAFCKMMTLQEMDLATWR